MSILLTVILAAALLPLLPLRLNAAYQDGVFTLSGRAGPLPVEIFPRRRAGKRRRKRGGSKSVKKLARLPLPVLRILAESGSDGLGRLLSRARVSGLRLRYTAAGPDPYRAVMNYARAGIAMEGLAAAIDGADLRAAVDLEGGPSSFSGRIGVTVRLGTVLAAFFCFGIGFLRRYYQYKREKE